jgi:cAMP phosphodiesterase
MGIRAAPVTVHASEETISTLRTHIFNWKVWPDFNTIPDVSEPFLLYNEVKLGETLDFNGRKITPLPANHVVSTFGYHVDSGDFSLVFTSDTTVCDALWVELNKIKNLKYIIIETAFSNSELELAKLSKHLCPSMLVAELGKLKLSKLNSDKPNPNKLSPAENNSPVEVYVTHFKPGEGERIMQEIAESYFALPVKALKNYQIFNF